MTDIEVNIEVNGKMTVARVEPRTLLLRFLREDLGLTGTHSGCETTSCGACTVLLDGRAVKSCTVFAAQADGRRVTTIEGLGTASEMDPIQVAFWEKHGLQCGFCTPGMVITTFELLGKNPDPDEGQIRVALSGNLCRCTGYVNVVESVLYAAKLRRKGGKKATSESSRKGEPSKLPREIEGM
jgi:aerobic carbon-monoxide dehydrogenase small subunit